LDWVCWCTGDQPPVAATSDKSGRELLLRSAEDFRIAAYRAKQIVRGHDQVIDSLLARTEEAVTLRARRRDQTAQPPLASFLLVGGEGVGKRYLARVAAKLLYRDGAVLAFECDRTTSGMLIGSKGAPGELIESVRRQPFQMIIFEGVHAAPPDVIQILSTILTRGAYRSPNSQKALSFQNTTVVMTTTKAVSVMEALEMESLSDEIWRERAIDVLVSETLIDQTVLHSVSDVLYCHWPSDEVKAEVVAMLMKKEARAHGVTLSRIDPEILVAQVLQINDSTGFALVPQRVKTLLRKPLVAATQHNRDLLSLRVRRPPILASGRES
jgi:hypothetical protein